MKAYFIYSPRHILVCCNGHVRRNLNCRFCLYIPINRGMYFETYINAAFTKLIGHKVLDINIYVILGRGP